MCILCAFLITPTALSRRLVSWFLFSNRISCFSGEITSVPSHTEAENKVDVLQKPIHNINFESNIYIYIYIYSLWMSLKHVKTSTIFTSVCENVHISGSLTRCLISAFVLDILMAYTCMSTIHKIIIYMS